MTRTPICWSEEYTGVGSALMYASKLAELLLPAIAKSPAAAKQWFQNCQLPLISLMVWRYSC